MKRHALFTLTVGLGLFLAACNSDSSKGDWVAKVGKSVISTTQLDQRIASFPPNVQAAFEKEENKSAIVDQLINEEILVQEASALGYENNDSYKERLASFQEQFDSAKKQALISLLLQEKVDAGLSISDQEIASFFDENKDQFAGYERRRASHILVKDETKAKNILAQLKKGADFAKLAREHSQDPTAQNGGDLGWFREGDLVPPFEKAVFSLKSSGDLSGVVKTQFGYHLIQLNSIEKVPAQTLDQAKANIERALYNQKRTTTFNKYLEDIKTKYKVTRKPAPAPEVTASTPAETK